MFAGIWARVVAAAAVVGAVLLAIARIRAGGREAERAEQSKRNEAARRAADEADRMVERAGDGELDELRRKWTQRR